MTTKTHGHQPKPRKDGRRPKTPTTGTGVHKAPGTAVAIRQEGNTPASATATMVALAQAKDFDAEKFKALADFQDKMVAQQARIDFANAQLAMQPEIPEIQTDGCIAIPAKDGKKAQKTPYATLPNINRIIKPILQKHGFTLWHRQDEQDGKIVIISTLARGQYSVESRTVLQLETSGSKNNTQGAGSSISYGKRYNTISLLNITSWAKEDRDDDGMAAGGGRSDLLQPIDQHQFEEIQKLLDDTGADVPKLCAMLGVTGTKLILKKDFDTAVRMLGMKSKKKAASP